MNRHKINWHKLECIVCGFTWATGVEALDARENECISPETQETPFQYYIPMVSSCKVELPKHVCKHMRIVRDFGPGGQCLDCGCRVVRASDLDLHNKVVPPKKCTHPNRKMTKSYIGGLIVECMDCGKSHSSLINLLQDVG